MAATRVCGSAQPGETHLDGEGGVGCSGVHALERLDVAVVAAAHHGDVVQADEDPVRRVERHPAAVPELDPGVALPLGGLADLGLALAGEVPGDVASGHTEAAQRPDGDVGEVLAHPSTLGPRLLRAGVHVGDPGLVGHVLADDLDDAVCGVARRPRPARLLGQLADLVAGYVRSVLVTCSF